jgi:hypothetical protein
MDINADSKEIVNNSFINWLKNKTLQKYFVSLAILEVALAVILISMMNEAFITFAQIEENQVGLIFDAIISFYSNLGIFLIPFSIIVVFFSYKIIQVGLKLTRRKSVELTIARYIKFFFYPVFASLAAIFSIFDLRYLAIGIVGGLITLIGGATILVNPGLGVLIAILGFLLMLAYFVIVIINMIKLSLGQIIFVEKEKSIFESLKESFVVTKGNVFNLFILELVFGLIISIISGVVSLPSTMYIQSLIATITDPTLIFSDLIYQVLLLPTYIVGAYAIICSNLFIVNIYSKIKSRK